MQHQQMLATTPCFMCAFKEQLVNSVFVLQSLVSRLDYEDPNLEAVLISLSQVARLQPQIFDSKQKAVIKEFVVKKLMLVDQVGVTVCW
jgi:hypothetical protein